MLKLSMPRRWRPALAVTLLVACGTLPARAQGGFQSGSTGADGPFNPATNQTVQVPESGVFNFTTINIPANVTITFAPNAKNTPVTLLATGDVVIEGTINVAGKTGNGNGTGGAGGPGGGAGGAAGFGLPGSSFSGLVGGGPGGGGGGGSANGTNIAGGGGGGYGTAGANGVGQNANAVLGAGGGVFGTNLLLPPIGGSGGGGGGATANNRGGAGGGGGGAVVVASSTTIRFGGNGFIDARGGSGGGPSFGGGGGGGAGGAIRLVANNITGGGFLYVNGGGGASGSVITNGTPFTSGGNGGAGYIRVEAFDASAFNPSTNDRVVSYGLPNPIMLANGPQLRIASVGGVAAPASPLGSFTGPPDVVVPGAQANPVEVVIEAANIPVGTTVQVKVTPSTGEASTVNSSPLAGTAATSSATAGITLPGGTSLLFATTTLNLTTASAQPMFIDGEQVARVEVSAAYGGASELIYITRSGRRIKMTE